MSDKNEHGGKILDLPPITHEDLLREEDEQEWNKIAVKEGLSFRKIVMRLNKILDDKDAKPKDIINVCEIGIKIKGAYAPDKHKVEGGGVRMTINVDDSDEEKENADG